MARKRYTQSGGNSRQGATTVKAVMNATPFGQGFRDVRAGLPFRPEYDSMGPNDQWKYERGRLLAVIYHGELKQGRKLLDAAMQAFVDAYRAKLIT